MSRVTEGPHPASVLAVNVSGNGTVTGAGISCAGTCSTSHNQGTVVMLTANPGNGARFDGWSGACSGSAPTCTVTITGDATVGAGFHQNTAPVCGNGFKEPGEACDDGNNNAFDHCSSDCQNSCTGSKIWCDCTSEHCATVDQCNRECDL